ncbi:hypothetical protein HYU95_06035 [Candidatus Daviesbacteria bacterium]|nr:hypothetical protein [Candidatus Daviesbacteria bacterium]
MEAKEHLRWLLEDHKDKVPKKKVHRGNYKVRGNWFQGVIGDLEECIADGGIGDPHVIAEAQGFIDEYCQHDFGQRTTVKDIQKANSVIRKVLGIEEPA